MTSAPLFSVELLHMQDNRIRNRFWAMVCFLHHIISKLDRFGSELSDHFETLEFEGLEILNLELWYLGALGFRRFTLLRSRKS